MRKTIAIDIDEVIADGTKSICEQINSLNNTSFSPEDWHAEKRPYDGFYADFAVKMNLEYGLDKLKSDMRLSQSHVPLKNGVREILPMLLKNSNVLLLTARQLDWKAETLNWIFDEFGDVFEDIVFSREHLNGPQKMDICHELGVDYMIDDRLNYLAAKQHHAVIPILFGDYAWHENIPENHIHCKDWHELGVYFEQEFKN